MKILFASDLHLGKSSWGSFGEDVLRRCAEGPKVDVFLFGGDLVEPHVNGVSLEDGLKLIQKIPAQVKLWVAGNNDIEHLHGKTSNILQDYAPMLQELGRRHGVHLLDYSVLQIDSTVFAGSYGACDLSLWKTPATLDDRFPSTLQELQTSANRSFQKHLNCSVMDLFNLCQSKLKKDIMEASWASKLVVATHVSPTPEFVFYGHSPGFDHKNAFMGWDDSKTKVPIHTAHNLALQVCGHTHRREYLKRPWATNQAPLLNISGDNQPRIEEI